MGRPIQPFSSTDLTGMDDRKILVFASARGALPFVYNGGSERSIFSLTHGLAEEGWQIVHLACLPFRWAPEDANELFSSFTIHISTHQSLHGIEIETVQPSWCLTAGGCLTILCFAPDDFGVASRSVVKAIKADCLVTWLKSCKDFVELGFKRDIPTVLMVFGPDAENLPDLYGNTTLLTNSHTSSVLCERRYGIKPHFINSIVNPDFCRCSNKEKKRHVLFVNPRIEKGLNLFVEIAKRLPNVTFLVLEAWQSPYKEEELQAIRFLKLLPNVAFLAPLTDMSAVYAKTALLLVPSHWIETFARVVVEAQINGIPALVSDSGELPGTVGKGGIVIATTQTDRWVAAITHLLESPDAYLRLSMLATENARRFDSAHLLRAFRDFLEGVMEK